MSLIEIIKYTAAGASGIVIIAMILYLWLMLGILVENLKLNVKEVISCVFLVGITLLLSFAIGYAVYA